MVDDRDLARLELEAIERVEADPDAERDERAEPAVHARPQRHPLIRRLATRNACAMVTDAATMTAIATVLIGLSIKVSRSAVGHGARMIMSIKSYVCDLPESPRRLAPYLSIDRPHNRS